MKAPKQLKSTAYDYIKEQILNDNFEYDKIYSETKLSKDIGISRTPIRDAIHRLAQERYIDIIPSKGFRIHQLTARDVIETFQIRSALESYCTYTISLNPDSPEHTSLFKELEGYQNKLREINESTRDIYEFAEYDAQFHCAIVNALKSTVMTDTFSNYIYQIKRLAILSLPHEGRMSNTIMEHQNILDAMKTGNSSSVYEITLKHMERPQSINLQELSLIYHGI